MFKAIKKTQQDGSIRWTKPPLQRDGKTPAKVNDSKTWCSFDDAIQAMAFCEHLDGIGFVLTKDDGYTAGDIDHCIDDNGKLTHDAASIIADIHSYSEKSPSGTGIRIICEGSLPDEIQSNKSGNYELYDSGRYITITGHHIEGTPLDCQSRPDAVKRYYQKYIQKSTHEEPLFTSTTSTEEKREEAPPPPLLLWKVCK